jgi:5'-nucleotidase / UDP-sugar diphosphatase
MKMTFTILHTNDVHWAFIGLGQASDYTPFTLNDDTTGVGTRACGRVDRRRPAPRVSSESRWPARIVCRC